MFILLITGALASVAQTGYTTDANGNLTQVVIKKTEADLTKGAVKTGKVFTTASGDEYPVWKSAAGRLFIVRTSKAGNAYKQYLEEQK